MHTSTVLKDKKKTVPCTSAKQEPKSNADWLACAPQEVIDEFLEGLSDHAIRALPYLWDFWAMPHQIPPESSDWRSWVILGGRGAGKTRAGAEWVRSQVEGSGPLDKGRARHVALIGETIGQAREVMVFGESGILEVTPEDRRPKWESSRRRLVWQNGAVAQIFSAHDPESLRGPQFDAAWVDELAKWKKARATWDMLQFGLRLGDKPRVVVTTTPRNQHMLKRILKSESTVSTSAPTSANRANLAASFLIEVERRYAGTRLGKQELEGILIEDLVDSLWPFHVFEKCRVKEPNTALDRIVVALDPPVSSGEKADLCGIIVAGVSTQGPPQDWHATILEDASLKGTPMAWIEAALDARDRHGADCLIAETNQGGDLIETLLRQHDALAAFKAVRASRSKAVRAEPVAALYEQGRVSHMPGLQALEEQMTQMTRLGFQGAGSPDRVDALVWALHDLMIAQAKFWRRPRVRML